MDLIRENERNQTYYNPFKNMLLKVLCAQPPHTAQSVDEIDENFL